MTRTTSAGFYMSGGDNGMGSFEVDTRVSDETIEYSAQLTINSDHRDPRSRCISLDRDGLHFGA